MNIDLQTTVTEIENTLQDARGELSRFEDKFPTDSPQSELIRELLDRLDEASDAEVIEEHVRDYSDDYGVERETLLVGDIREGDILFAFGDVVEVIKTDGWWHENSDGGGYNEHELTVQPYQGEAFTTVHNSGKTFEVALRD